MTSLGLIGVGAFGGFMIPHLAPHFQIRAYDAAADLAHYATRFGIEPADLEACAQADVVVIATPVQTIEDMARTVAPHVKPGALVLDVGSVKIKPAQALSQHIPAHADIVCTHPLFGPQSAQEGVEGLKISICPVRGDRQDCVVRFLSEVLELQVIVTTPEAHDRQLAYVQGLTHLIGQTLLAMPLESFDQTTVSFDLMREAVSFIKGDSRQLFEAIETENPFAADVRKAFFEAVAKLEEDLSAHPEPGRGAGTGPALS